jgi:hypothetical protein
MAGAKPADDGREDHERRGTMKFMSRSWSVFTAVGLLLFMGSSSCLSADDTAASVNTKAIDQNLHLALREVINQGADLFNGPPRDPDGCYRLYQGALITARSQLGHHADVQKLIDDGLARTDRGSMGKRAWALRKLLDEVREKINPNPKKSAEVSKPPDAQPAKPPEKKPEDAKSKEKKPAPDKSEESKKKKDDQKSGDQKPPDKKPEDKSKDK